jgi:hypothetical protein
MQGYLHPIERAHQSTPSKNLRKNLRLAALLAYSILLTSFSTLALSASIQLIEEERAILIEGQIKRGDYSKLVQTILKSGPSYGRIYLASPGGDALEAIKIGRLIRSLGYVTEAPMLIGNRPICRSFDVAQQNCVCFSACTLIYLAGAERRGDYLGVHRIYLDPAAVKEMNFKESAALTNNLSLLLHAYLVEMNAPKTLIDRIDTASSNEIDILESEYVDKYLSGFVPEYEDWIIAKCGDSKAFIKRITSTTEELRKFKEYQPELDKISDCEFEKLFDVRLKAYGELRRKYPEPPVKLSDIPDVLTEEQAKELRSILKK